MRQVSDDEPALCGGLSSRGSALPRPRLALARRLVADFISLRHGTLRSLILTSSQKEQTRRSSTTYKIDRLEPVVISRVKAVSVGSSKGEKKQEA
jgi:hypothetical protein